MHGSFDPHREERRRERNFNVVLLVLMITLLASAIAMIDLLYRVTHGG